MIRPVLALVFLAIPGTGALAGPSRPAPETIVLLHCAADGSLAGIEREGRRFDLAPDEGQDSFAARAFQGVKSPVELVGTTDTPYRCIGGAIFLSQLAGIRQVNFVSEPGPVKDR